MPSGCSVVGCRLGDRPKDALYHRFPKEEGIREEWVIFSGKKKVNFKFERICSVHFKETDYERRLKYEILGLPVPRHRRNLKKDAIPSKNKPKVKDEPNPVNIVEDLVRNYLFRSRYSLRGAIENTFLNE
nr:uncharacterized protein LOC113825388 [Penaeus vannamei]